MPYDIGFEQAIDSTPKVPGSLKFNREIWEEILCGQN